YLREFLMDGRVIDIHPIKRWILVNLIISTFRAPRSARAYQKIWREEGSPLLHHSRDLTKRVDDELPEWPVVLAMRYGNPSIAQGLAELEARGCDHLIVMPLYPQYAASSTGSTVEAVCRQVQERWNTPFISVVPPFFAAPPFIKAFAAVGQNALERFAPDHVLFSFHGLPEHHMHKGDPTGAHCLVRPDCCEQAAADGATVGQQCYRAQSFVTARLLARELGLEDDGWCVSFQSRLGRREWIKPYTDHRVLELAKSGVKRLAVFCPAFVADCLETLEEIGMEAREEFREAGGEDLLLVPSLNATEPWVKAVCALVSDAAIPSTRLPVIS
ncbi:MAG: ferrochelatase, partial [Nannocystaceae bacterium]